VCRTRLLSSTYSIDPVGADVQQTDLHGRHALHYACRHGHEEIAHYLLSKKSPPDYPDQDGMTPMTMAVIAGKANCVRQLLDFDASVNSPNESAIPLNLACQYGHTEIARLLLARNPTIAINSEGLYPLHLAARIGNKDILALLMEYDNGGIDVQERFSLWTPLFFAASEGHDECVKQLLQTGPLIDKRDDSGHSAIYWSAWAGHLGCMDLLFEAGARAEHNQTTKAESYPKSRSSQSDDLEIPTLSLPPPIIPSFGHNFLEKKVCVQLRLGRKPSTEPQVVQPVVLYNDAPLTSAKLTVSPKGCDDIVPRSILLPLTDDNQRSMSFYVDKIEDFSIDFELYPTFGSKVIGKASALGDIFSQRDKAIQRSDSGTIFCTLPIFDSRLKVIGETSFEFSIIKPFQGVHLEIGGKVETYWKSTRPLPASTSGTPSLTTTSQPGLITASSLSGEFVRVFVQVTRDLVPVAYPAWLLPVEGVNLGVSEVTFAQFQSIIAKAALETASDDAFRSIVGATDAQSLVPMSFLSLAQLLSALPSSIHLNLQILYPSYSEREYLSIDHVPEVNDFIDSVLQAVFEDAESPPTSGGEVHSGTQNRRILFSSFNPDICTTINWKQPNCTPGLVICANVSDAVFFANYIGKSPGLAETVSFLPANSFPASQPLPVRLSTDLRCRSIRDAVKFSKFNNLLGLICQASLLVIPSLESANSVVESPRVDSEHKRERTSPGNIRIERGSGRMQQDTGAIDRWVDAQRIVNI
jgi:CDK inhibitor PHO81